MRLSRLHPWWTALERIPSDLLGEGLPAPASEFKRTGFVADAPGLWCTWCGSSAHAATQCRTRGPPYQLPLVRLGPHDGALRDWIIAIKHNQWEAMGSELGRMLGGQLLRCFPRLHELKQERRSLGVRALAHPHARAPKRRVVVVPVPMPWIRRLDRGIDHSAVIAAAAAKVVGVPCVQPLRQAARSSQVMASGRAHRLAHGDRFCAPGKLSSFLSPRAWRARFAVRHSTVILVDDVRTTGATLAQMSEQLHRMGARVIVPAVLSVKE